MDPLEDAKAPSARVLRTLKLLENPKWTLLQFKPNDFGALLSKDFDVERIPPSRIRHMLERGYIIQIRNSGFASLGWLEYETTYDTSMLLNNHRVPT